MVVIFLRANYLPKTMNFRFVYALCCLLGVILSSAVNTPSPVREQNAIPNIQSQFGMKMMKAVCGDENCVFSPYSIYNILSMVLMGAGGNTEAELMDALILTGKFQNDQELHAAVGEVKQKLLLGAQKNLGTEVNLADNMYVSDIYPVSRQYINALQQYYSVDGPYTQNFSDGEESADTINTFVEEQTKGQITQLFQPDMFNSDTLAVLVNAIYFNASWQVPFLEVFTREADFYVNSSSVIQVPMMYHDNAFRYSMGGDKDVLELPYSGGDFAMYVVSPKAVFNDVRESMISDTQFVQKMDAQLRQGRVMVRLPKFSFASQVDLKTQLQKQFGVRDLFTDGVADLFGVVPNGSERSPFISEALHKATIDVTEYGTVASGATGVVFMFESAPPVFKVDRPFMYMIVYKPTWTILFMGQVVDPTKTE